MKYRYNILWKEIRLKNENLIMEIFNNETKDFISNLIEEKLSILKGNKDFKEKYARLSDAMDELEKTLSKNQK